MLTLVTAENIDQMVLIANTKGPGIDIAEVCGGVGRTTKIGIRRKLKCGPNFDLVCNCDLTDPADQQSCLKYFTDHHVLHSSTHLGSFWTHVTPQVAFASRDNV